MTGEVLVPVGAMNHDSGTSDGHPAVSYRVGSGREFPRDGVGRGWIVRGTVLEVKEVYTDEAVSD